MQQSWQSLCQLMELLGFQSFIQSGCPLPMKSISTEVSHISRRNDNRFDRQCGARLGHQSAWLPWHLQISAYTDARPLLILLLFEISSKLRVRIRPRSSKDISSCGGAEACVHWQWERWFAEVVHEEHWVCGRRIVCRYWGYELRFGCLGRREGRHGFDLVSWSCRVRVESAGLLLDVLRLCGYLWSRWLQ